MALVAVVLLLLATTLLAHGALTISRLQYRAARAAEAMLSARLAADAGVERALVMGGAVERSGIREWATSGRVLGRSGDASSSTSFSRLSRELWWVESIGSRGAIRSQRSATAVWALDPLTRTASSQGVIVHGGGGETVLAGRVDGSEFLGDSAYPPPGGCKRWLSGLDSLGAARTLPVAVEDDSTAVMLGRLSVDSAVLRLTHLPSAVGSPQPVVERGRCASDSPWNWGDPLQPYAICSEHIVQVGAEGGLTLSDGIGQGLLVVDGDLLLQDVAFFGMILARGDVRLLGSTRVEGLVRAGGTATVGPMATVVASGCWAAVALQSEEMMLPLRIPGSGKIGPLE